MSEVMTIEKSAFQQLMQRFDQLEQLVKGKIVSAQFSKWMNEDEVIAATGLSKHSLYNKRKEGKLRYSTVSGRKPKYLRSDVEAYVNGISK